MKIINKFKFCLLVITSISVFLATKSFALEGNMKGVPDIKASAMMTGLTAPWDMDFTKDMKAMFFTEKSQFREEINFPVKSHFGFQKYTFSQKTGFS